MSHLQYGLEFEQLVFERAVVLSHVLKCELIGECGPLVFPDRRLLGLGWPPDGALGPGAIVVLEHRPSERRHGRQRDGRTGREGQRDTQTKVGNQANQIQTETCIQACIHTQTSFLYV